MRLAWLAGLGALLLAGCGPKPIYRSDPVSAPPTSASAVSKSKVEEVSSPWLGTPYRYGGTGSRGIDCSALSQNILGDLGTSLPRTVDDQKRLGEPVPVSKIAPGDLVFFRLESNQVNHVGVALDAHRFVHASSSRGVVVDHLMDKYFSRNFVEARRVLRD